MTIQPLIDYINRHISLTPHEEEVLRANVRLRKYLKNQYVVQQGDVCKYESFVIKGCIKTFYLDEAGSEHIVMFSVENWWTADLGSFITQTPADYNLQCLENCLLAQISYDVIEHLFDEIPKLERFFRIIIQNALVASQKRIIRNLSLSARDKYLAFKEEYPEVEQRVPQYMIAAYLGFTPEFLSKTKKQILLSE